MKLGTWFPPFFSGEIRKITKNTKKRPKKSSSLNFGFKNPENTQNPEEEKNGETKKQNKKRSLLNFYRTQVYHLPFLGVNDYFLGKCSLIVSDDKFLGISADFMGVNDHSGEH